MIRTKRTCIKWKSANLTCLICIATFVILANNIKNIQYKNLEYNRGMKQSIEQMIGNSYKNSFLRNRFVHPRRTTKVIVSCSQQLNLSTGAKTGTSLKDIFISVKSTAWNHRFRLDLLLKTWISFAIKQTYIFTDADDPKLNEQLEYGHVINTNCSKGHDNKSLLCKMAQEFDWFVNSEKRWFCHVDDDTYLNIQRLLTFLQQYNHTDDLYLGRPSLNHPKVIKDRAYPGQNMSFWFATGGAGFCISQALALKMVPHAGGGRLMRAGEQNRLADDCVIGYIIESILHEKLTKIELFHSHLEELGKLSLQKIKEQISFSYCLKRGHHNVMSIHGFPKGKDATRFMSIHCHLYPLSQICQKMATI